MQSLEVYKYVTSLARSRSDDLTQGRNETAHRNRTFKGERVSIHVFASHQECACILKDKSFIQPRIADAIAEIGKSAGPSLNSIESFLRSNPIGMNGPPHNNARQTAIKEYGETQRNLATELPDLGRKAFAAFLERKSPKILTDLAEPYVDSVLESIFSKKSNAAAFSRESWRGNASCIFEYLHSATQLKMKAQQALDLASEFHSKIGNTVDEGAQSDALLLTYLFQGRDPLIGAIAAYMHALLAMDETKRNSDIETTTARDLFWRTSPVNYIGRIATKAGSVGDISIQPGDEIVLILGWANHDRNATARDSLAFGAGPHICAGQALALAIADAWLNSLRHHYASINWHGIHPDRSTPAVFRQYRNP